MDTVTKRGATGAGDTTLNDFLPPESPTEMSVQPLRRFEPPPAPGFAPMWLRRGSVLTGTAVLAAAGCYEMYRVLQVGGVRHHGSAHADGCARHIDEGCGQEAAGQRLGDADRPAAGGETTEHFARLGQWGHVRALRRPRTSLIA